MLNQISIEGILSGNPIPYNVKVHLLLDPYLTEFHSEQGKRFPLNLVNLQQRIAFGYAPFTKIWTVLEKTKKLCQMKTQKFILARKIR